MQSGIQRIDLKELCKNINQTRQRQKEYYDKKRREATRFKESDVIMAQVTSEIATGKSRKLRPKFKGPFRITKVLSNDRHDVEDMREHCKRSSTVVAAERLKTWQ